LVEWVPLLLVIAMATALRFWALGSIPPGLYHDEAFNGLDALGVLEGERPVFFEANNGREPLFIYLVALSVAVLGRSPGAIRMVAALLGTLTIPASYLMAKAMFNRRIGLLAAVITGLTLWHVNLSRVGFRAVAMPLLVALTLWQLWLGLKDGNRRHFLAGGLLYGLTFYTYLAARFTILALAVFGLYLVGGWRPALSGVLSLSKGLVEGLEARGWRRGALAFALAALVVLTPLMVYVATHGDAFLGRVGQVSIFNPTINEGDFWGTLLRHVGKTLLMFTNRGDFIPRHNVPLRPVFDPVLSAFFLLGLILCLRRFRQRAEHAFVVIWLAVMLLPTILAEGAPHFLRSVGILPVAFVVPAVGLDSLWCFLENKSIAPVAAGAVALALVFGLGDTTIDYFGDHAASQDVRYNFETAAVDLATQANRFLGTGWDGTRLRARQNAPLPERHLYIAERLWRDWASVRFLVPPSPNLTILGENDKLSEHSSAEVMLILWPYEDYRQYLSLLPVGSTIAVQEGSLERGDLEKEARLLYITFTATATTVPSGGPEARFEKGLTLVDHRLDAVSPRELRLSLLWRAEAEIGADYTVFVHLTRDDVILAQDDSLPAGGYYPTSLWRVGDIVDDEHTLALPGPYDPGKHKLVVGFYQLETLHRLQVLDEAGKPVSDHVIIE
jgi:4-amino-4-deoxy-L-arabinose transferase-like glycosyltransferase